MFTLNFRENRRLLRSVHHFSNKNFTHIDWHIIRIYIRFHFLSIILHVCACSKIMCKSYFPCIIVIVFFSVNYVKNGFHFILSLSPSRSFAFSSVEIVCYGWFFLKIHCFFFSQLPTLLLFRSANSFYCTKNFHFTSLLAHKFYRLWFWCPFKIRYTHKNKNRGKNFIRK